MINIDLRAAMMMLCMKNDVFTFMYVEVAIIQNTKTELARICLFSMGMWDGGICLQLFVVEVAIIGIGAGEP